MSSNCTTGGGSLISSWGAVASLAVRIGPASICLALATRARCSRTAFDDSTSARRLGTLYTLSRYTNISISTTNKLTKLSQNTVNINLIISNVSLEHCFSDPRIVRITLIIVGCVYHWQGCCGSPCERKEWYKVVGVTAVQVEVHQLCGCSHKCRPRSPGKYVTTFCIATRHSAPASSAQLR